MEPLTPADPPGAGEFRLRARLGAGGMGRVYLGFSPAGRAVAVKIVQPGLARDQGFRARFRQEVAAVRAVSGIYTAQVVAAGPDDQPPWMATAFVPGPALDEIVAEHGPLPEPAQWRLLSGLVEALAAVHASGVVHRDLKPGNVLLATDGPRLIDFGISRAMEGPALTRTGEVAGTPGFMSPEQAEGGRISPASDVFSLGCLLAYAATGEEPFGSGSAAAMLYRIVHGAPALDGMPARLRDIAAGCLAKDAAMRPALPVLAAAAARGSQGADPSAASFWPGPFGRVVAGYQAAVDAQLQALLAGPVPAGRPPAGQFPQAQYQQREYPQPEYQRREYPQSQFPVPQFPAGQSPEGAGPGRPAQGYPPARPAARAPVQPQRLAPPATGAPLPPPRFAPSGPGMQRQAPAGPGAPPRPGPPWPPGPGTPPPGPGTPPPGGYAPPGRQRFPGGPPVQGRPPGSGPRMLPGRPAVPSLPAGTGQPPPGRSISRRRMLLIGAGAVSAAGLFYGGVRLERKPSAPPPVTASAGLWSFRASEEIQSAIAFADGVVYAGSNDKNVYAIDAATGRSRWAYLTSDQVQNGPVVSGGVVYAGNSSGDVYALNAGAGQVLWHFGTGGPAVSAPVVADGRVFVAGILSTLYVLDAANGTVRKQISTANDLNPDATGSAGLVFASDLQGNLMAFRAGDLGMAWQQSLTADSNLQPMTAAGGRVYLGDDGGKVYAVDAGTGNRLWTATTAGQIQAAPAVAGGTVAVISGGYLYGFGAADGRPAWRFYVNWDYARPSGGGGTFYVGGFDKFYAVAASSGRLAWTYSNENLSSVSSRAAIAAGSVYFGDDSGDVVAVRP